MKTVHNKNYMSIAVSVLTTSRLARNSSAATQQENRPQSANTYSSVRYAIYEETNANRQIYRKY
jgi:hypothetical protein